MGFYDELCKWLWFIALSQGKLTQEMSKRASYVEYAAYVREGRSDGIRRFHPFYLFLILLYV